MRIALVLVTLVALSACSEAPRCETEDGGVMQPTYFLTNGKVRASLAANSCELMGAEAITEVADVGAAMALCAEDGDNEMCWVYVGADWGPRPWVWSPSEMMHTIFGDEVTARSVCVVR